MKVGAWIHTTGMGLEEQVEAAAGCGLKAIRSYSLDYAEQSAPALKRSGLGLLGRQPNTCISMKSTSASTQIGSSYNPRPCSDARSRRDAWCTCKSNTGASGRP